MDSRRRNERTAERIPNKTRWALEAIRAETDKLQRNWERHTEHVEKSADLKGALLLMEARDSIAKIERLTIDASHGEFIER